MRRIIIQEIITKKKWKELPSGDFERHLPETDLVKNNSNIIFKEFDVSKFVKFRNEKYWKTFKIIDKT
jgi:hypothetical protein